MTKKRHWMDYRFVGKASFDIKEYKHEHNFRAIKIIYELLNDIEINGELQGNGFPND